MNENQTSVTDISKIHKYLEYNSIFTSICKTKEKFYKDRSDFNMYENKHTPIKQWDPDKTILQENFMTKNAYS